MKKQGFNSAAASTRRNSVASVDVRNRFLSSRRATTAWRLHRFRTQRRAPPRRARAGARGTWADSASSMQGHGGMTCMLDSNVVSARHAQLDTARRHHRRHQRDACAAAAHCCAKSRSSPAVCAVARPRGAQRPAAPTVCNSMPDARATRAVERRDPRPCAAFRSRSPCARRAACKWDATRGACARFIASPTRRRVSYRAVAQMSPAARGWL